MRLTCLHTHRTCEWLGQCLFVLSFLLTFTAFLFFVTYSSVGYASVFGFLCTHRTCMLVFIVNRETFFRLVHYLSFFFFFLLFHQILSISIRKITEQLYHHVEMM